MAALIEQLVHVIVDEAIQRTPFVDGVAPGRGVGCEVRARGTPLPREIAAHDRGLSLSQQADAGLTIRW